MLELHFTPSLLKEQIFKKSSTSGSTKKSMSHFRQAREEEWDWSSPPAMQ
jgi:hypothetical protein